MTISSLIGRHLLGFAVTLFALSVLISLNWTEFEELAFYQEPVDETDTTVEDDSFEQLDFNDNYLFLDGIFQKVEPPPGESTPDESTDPVESQPDAKAADPEQLPDLPKIDPPPPIFPPPSP